MDIWYEWYSNFAQKEQNFAKFTWCNEQFIHSCQTPADPTNQHYERDRDKANNFMRYRNFAREMWIDTLMVLCEGNTQPIWNYNQSNVHKYLFYLLSGCNIWMWMLGNQWYGSPTRNCNVHIWLWRVPCSHHAGSRSSSWGSKEWMYYNGTSQSYNNKILRWGIKIQSIHYGFFMLNCLEPYFYPWPTFTLIFVSPPRKIPR